MASSPKKQCSLDVNVLLDLAEGKPFARNFFGVVRDCFCPLFLSPTAFIELELLAEGHEPGTPFAKKAIPMLQKWGVTLFNIKPIQHGYAAEFSRELIRSGFLPDGEFNDGLILAETACMEIPILVTSDDHLLGIEPKALLEKFKERSLHPALPIAPWKIARSVR